MFPDGSRGADADTALVTGLLGIWCQGTRAGNSGMEHILFLDSIEETSGNKRLK